MGVIKWVFYKNKCQTCFLNIYMKEVRIPPKLGKNKILLSKRPASRPDIKKSGKILGLTSAKLDNKIP